MTALDPRVVHCYRMVRPGPYPDRALFHPATAWLEHELEAVGPTTNPAAGHCDPVPRESGDRVGRVTLRGASRGPVPAGTALLQYRRREGEAGLAGCESADTPDAQGRDRVRTGLVNPRKLTLARAFDATGLSGAGLRLQRTALGPHVRVINYHSVPPSQARSFEEQLRFYAAHFEPVGLAELVGLGAGRWRPRRAGIALTFDDGCRSHAEVAAPLLERYGFPGWFFVPVRFLDLEPGQQAAFAEARRIQVTREWPDARVAMTWAEVRELDRRHVVGCHTLTHERLTAALGVARTREEVVTAKQVLEARLGHAVTTFAWVGGEESSYSEEAAQLIREAGFRVSLMTNNAVFRPGADLLQVQRTNVEAFFPPNLVRFQLSGVLDLLYAPKRSRVNRVTAAR